MKTGFNNLNRLNNQIFFSFLFFLLLFLFQSQFQNQAYAGSRIALDADQLYDYALKSYRSGDYAESAYALHSFVHFFPEDKKVGKAMLMRGFSMYSQKKYSEAASVFKTVFESVRFGADETNTAGFMTAQSLAASGDRPSAIAFMENWMQATGNDSAFMDRIRYETAWLYLSNDDMQAAEKRFSSVKSADEYRTDEISKKLETVSSFEKSPVIAGTLAVIPGAGFAYLGRYSDAFAAFVVNSALAVAAFQSFDSDMPALGGIISFVGAGFYLGGVYGSAAAAKKMNRNSRAAFYESMRTSLYVKEKGAGFGFSFDF